ncbi:IE-1 [Bombyx mandarina nucleopolyhedrovirus]|uniref:IE-1 n=1 Tax=Bombyx mandarina nucleopolyhedrovirus TaxID=640862 RepID=C3VP36_NPVBM|nr:IE-1 [Bombyx mandarina nucleopolyhedrovirus]
MTQINFNASYTSAPTPSRASFDNGYSEFCDKQQPNDYLNYYNNPTPDGADAVVSDSETAAASNFLASVNSLTDDNDIMECLLKTTDNLGEAVSSAYYSESLELPVAEQPSPSSAYNAESFEQSVGVNQPSATGTKRKLDEYLDDSQSVVGQFNKNKLKPKYKKSTIQSCATLEQTINHNTNICTVASTQEITHYFTNDFAPYLMRFDDNDYNSNRFSDHMSETGYYMFVVKKSEVKPFEIIFAKYVSNVVYEYTNNYYMVDNRVFVVTFDKIRFMISYNLVKETGIEIPHSQDVCNDETAAQNCKKCHFVDVHHTFKAALTSYFNLDMYYAQTTFVTLLQSLGERKCGFLLGKLYEMYQDKNLFTLPIMLSRKESNEIETASNNFFVSPYVSQILKYSESVKFPDNPPNKYVVDNLNLIVNKKSTLTYKYSSVANLLFNNYKYHDNIASNNNAENLKKVKKEDGSMHIVEQYLTQNVDNVKGHNFIVLSFKNEERLTIAKKNEEFYWISGEIKDVDASQVIQKYNRFKHHMFVISKVNRRESTTLHNNLLKLLALILQGLVPLSDAITFAEQKLNCKYKKIEFN